VNSIGRSNLTAQVPQHRRRHHCGGQRRPLSKKITVDVRGEIPASSRKPSTPWWTQLRSFASEVTPRGARSRAPMASLGGQAIVPGVAGNPGRTLTDFGERRMCGKPDRPGAQYRASHHRPVAAAATFSRKITVDVKGENPGAERQPSTPWWTSSNGFASEVTRVAREGRQPKASLGGQAAVPRRRPAPGRTSPTASTSLASNLTAQVRNIRRRRHRHRRRRPVEEDHRETCRGEIPATQRPP